MTKTTQHLQLSPEDNDRLFALCGQNDEHLLLIETTLGVSIQNRGHDFTITAKSATKAKQAINLIEELYNLTATQDTLDLGEINLRLRFINESQLVEKFNEINVRTKRGIIKARGNNQKIYVNNILTHDINFGVGPAGTGKTYLAVACAVNALEKDQVKRIVLVRPAVEAGEKLGFLPGDLAQKVDPYLRPLYDALYEMLDFEKVEKFLAKNVIEIAPLAYMRGRTLNNAFIILDESQNTTAEQMKMFLTRIGFGSTAVITGDITQIDLAQNKKSGLLHIIDVLKDISGISFTHFEPKDVVRHPLVQIIVEAYERYENNR